MTLMNAIRKSQNKIDSYPWLSDTNSQTFSDFVRKSHKFSKTFRLSWNLNPMAVTSREESKQISQTQLFLQSKKL